MGLGAMPMAVHAADVSSQTRRAATMSKGVSRSRRVTATRPLGAKQPHHPDRRYLVGWIVAGRFILSMQSRDGLCAPLAQDQD